MEMLTLSFTCGEVAYSREELCTVHNFVQDIFTAKDSFKSTAIHAVDWLQDSWDSMSHR